MHRGRMYAQQRGEAGVFPTYLHSRFADQIICHETRLATNILSSFKIISYLNTCH